MINKPLVYNGHGLKTTMGMLRKAWHRCSVVHAPSVAGVEILPDITAGERGRRAELVVALWIRIIVIGTKQEGVASLPRKG